MVFHLYVLYQCNWSKEYSISLDWQSCPFSPICPHSIHSAWFVFQKHCNWIPKTIKKRKKKKKTITRQLSLSLSNQLKTQRCAVLSKSRESQLIYAWNSTGNSAHTKTGFIIRISHYSVEKKRERRKDYYHKYIIVLFFMWLIQMTHQRFIMYAE